MTTLRSTVLAVWISLSGCTGEASLNGDAGRDDAPTTDGRAPLRCTVQPDESCELCFVRVGRCCYDDATLKGHVQEVRANCESYPACRACCSECAAMSCAELRASGRCPNM